MSEPERRDPAREAVDGATAATPAGPTRDGEPGATPGPAAPVLGPDDAAVDAAHLDDPDPAAADAAAAEAADDEEERTAEPDPATADVALEEDPRTKAELLAELSEAEARRDEYLDDVRRARAEFENYRRRIMREGATQRELGKAVVLERLLDVLDDLDRTLEAAAASQDQAVGRGVELFGAKLVQALQGIGLERIDTPGVSFDPNQHEAVQQQAADEPAGEPTVREVLRPGYRLGDRVLRAAMVVVEQ